MFDMHLVTVLGRRYDENNRVYGAAVYSDFLIRSSRQCEALAAFAVCWPLQWHFQLESERHQVYYCMSQILKIPGRNPLHDTRFLPIKDFAEDCVRVYQSGSNRLSNVRFQVRYPPQAVLAMVPRGEGVNIPTLDDLKRVVEDCHDLGSTLWNPDIEARLAIAMAKHARLGEGSHMADLEPETLKEAAWYAF